MSAVATNIALIFLFILVGGVFAAAEMALVSLRESQVKQLRTRGKRGQQLARLAEDPNKFLSAVQIGVTLAGFLSASFGGATLAPVLAPQLAKLGMSLGVAEKIALVLITIAISYFSIVLGELSAKRLAMQRAEGFAMALSPLVAFIARVTSPFIWFLGISTDAVVRVLGGDPDANREEVTDEELRAMVSGSATLGVEERQIVDEVFAAGERTLREVMVPRTEVDFLPSDMPAYRAIREVQGAPHSRYPVTNDSSDDIVGFLHVRDLFDLDPPTRNAPVGQLSRPVLSLPETVRVLRALSEMRRVSAHLAIVTDEYGGTAGIVTMEDLVEELIGDITDEYDVVENPAPARADLDEVDGLLTLEDFAEKVGYVLPEGPYDTVAGYFMAQRGQLPQVGDIVEVVLQPEQGEEGPAQRFQIEVAELDGRRASRLKLRRLGEEPPGAPS